MAHVDDAHLHNAGRAAPYAVAREAQVPTTIEIVECSPPPGNVDITSLFPTRVVCDTLGRLVRADHLTRQRGA